MRAEKAMATVSHALETMAIKDNSRLRIYNQPNSLSSIINELLAGLLVGLHYPHLSTPERTNVLNTIDSLLRLKVDIRRNKRGNYGC